MTVRHFPAVLASVAALAIGTGAATADQFDALAGIDAEQMSRPELDEVAGKFVYIDYSIGMYRYYNYYGPDWVWANNQWVTEAQYASMLQNLIQSLNAQIAQAQASGNSIFANQISSIMNQHNQNLIDIILD